MKTQKLFALALAAALLLSLTGCGKTENNNDPDEVENPFVGRWVSDEDQTLFYDFGEDLGFTAVQGEGVLYTGEYTHDGEDATVTAGENDETSIRIELISDGTVTVTVGAGTSRFFRRISEAVKAELPEVGETTSADNGDGSLTLQNSMLAVSVTCLDSMTRVTDVALDTAAVILTDGSEGYVTARNLTDYYKRFSGTADELATGYVNDYIYPDFTRLYGGYPSYRDYNLSHPDIDGRYATGDIKLSNDEADVQVDFMLNAVLDEQGAVLSVTALTFYSPRDDKSHRQELQKSVLSCEVYSPED